MNKKMLVAACVIVSLIFGATSALAAEGIKYGLGVNLNYCQMLDDSLDLTVEKNALTYGDVDYDAAVMFGGTATAFLNEYFSIEMGLSYAKTNLDVTHSYKRKPDGKWIVMQQEIGEVSHVPLSVTGRVHIPVNDMFSPYLGLGFGYAWNNFDQANDYVANTAKLAEKYQGAGITNSERKKISGFEIDDDWEFHFGGGVEVNATANVALTVDAKYVLHSSDFGNTYRKSDIEMGQFVMGAGVKYYF